MKNNIDEIANNKTNSENKPEVTSDNINEINTQKKDITSNEYIQSNRKLLSITKISIFAIILFLGAALLISMHNNNDDLPTFSIEGDELTFEELDDTEDEETKNTEKINYTFSNLPETINTATISKGVNIDSSAVELFYTDDIVTIADDYSNNYCSELLRNEETLETIYIEYNKTGEILKNFKLKNDTLDYYEYLKKLPNEEILLSGEYVNDNNTFEYILETYNYKGNCTNTARIGTNQMVEEIYYSNELGKILVTHSDLREIDYISIYDTKLNKINQFKIGKYNWNSHTISLNKDIFVFSTTRVNKNDYDTFTLNLHKYNEDGKLLFSKEIMSKIDNTYIFSVKPYNNGFILNIEQDLYTDDTLNDLKYTFIKIDNSGDIVWHLETPDNIYIEDAFEINNEIFTLGMNSFPSNEDAEVFTYLTTVSKYDISGNEIWTKYLTYEPENIEEEYNKDNIFSDFFILNPTADNEYIYLNGYYYVINLNTHENILNITNEFAINTNGDFVNNTN